MTTRPNLKICRSTERSLPPEAEPEDDIYPGALAPAIHDRSPISCTKNLRKVLRVLASSLCFPFPYKAIRRAKQKARSSRDKNQVRSGSSYDTIQVRSDPPEGTNELESRSSMLRAKAIRWKGSQKKPLRLEDRHLYAGAVAHGGNKDVETGRMGHRPETVRSIRRHVPRRQAKMERTGRAKRWIRELPSDMRNIS